MALIWLVTWWNLVHFVPQRPIIILFKVMRITFSFENVWNRPHVALANFQRQQVYTSIHIMIGKGISVNNSLMT